MPPIVPLGSRRSSRLAQLATGSVARLSRQYPMARLTRLSRPDQAVVDFAKSYRPGLSISPRKQHLMKAITCERRFPTRIMRLVKKFPVLADKLMELASAAHTSEALSSTPSKSIPIAAMKGTQERQDTIQEEGQVSSAGFTDLQQSSIASSPSAEDNAPEFVSQKSPSTFNEKSVDTHVTPAIATSRHAMRNGGADLVSQSTITSLKRKQEVTETNDDKDDLSKRQKLTAGPDASPKRKRDPIESHIDSDSSTKRQKLTAEEQHTSHSSFAGGMVHMSLDSILAELQSHTQKVPKPSSDELRMKDLENAKSGFQTGTFMLSSAHQDTSGMTLDSHATAKTPARKPAVTSSAAPKASSAQPPVDPSNPLGLEMPSGPSRPTGVLPSYYYAPPPGYVLTRLGYTAQCDRKLDRMDIEFDIPTNKAQQEYDDILIRAQTSMIYLFDELTPERLNKDGARFARNLLCEIPGAMELITGLRFEDARDALLHYCIDRRFVTPASGYSQTIMGWQICLAAFHALLTVQVWQAELLSNLGVFNSPTDPFMMAMEEMYKTVGACGEPREINLLRYHMRDTQRRLFNSPKVQAKIDKLADEIMEKFELATTIFKPDRVLEPDIHRKQALICIQKAIRLKCRMELAGHDWQVKWEARINSPFDLSRMEALSQVDKFVYQDLIEPNEHRVRLPESPALWLARPMGNNKEGLLASERRELIKSLPQDKRASYSFGTPILLTAAKVMIFDGNVEGYINGVNPAVTKL